MKILQKSITGEQSFSCDNCATKFIAQENEYRYRKDDLLVKTKDFGFLRMRTMGIYRPVWIVSCDCPVCNWTATKNIPAGDTYEKEVFYPDYQ